MILVLVDITIASGGARFGLERDHGVCPAGRFTY